MHLPAHKPVKQSVTKGKGLVYVDKGDWPPYDLLTVANSTLSVVF